MDSPGHQSEVNAAAYVVAATTREPFGSVEPDQRVEEAVCLNCGQLGTGAFCANCGQEMQMEVMRLGRYLHVMLQEFFAFDSKVLHSLIPLVIRPGFLTKEYLAGKRKRYVLPARIYVGLAIVAFFLISHFKPFDIEHFWFNGMNVKLVNGKKDPAELLALFNAHANDMLSPLMLFFVIPMYALTLKVLYWRKRVLYLEHLTFCFHFFAFTLITITPGILTGNILVQKIGFGLDLIYLLFALRAVHPERWRILVPRFLFAAFGFFTILTLMLAIDFGLTIFLIRDKLS